MKQKKENESNCIIINGECHVLREAELDGSSICTQCSLHYICNETIEHPLCEILHNASVHEVYKLKNDGNTCLS